MLAFRFGAALVLPALLAAGAVGVGAGVGRDLPIARSLRRSSEILLV